MLQTRAISQAARSGLGIAKSQTQAKKTHGEQGKREPHVRGGPVAERRQIGKQNTRLNPGWQRAAALREKEKEETEQLMRALQQTGQEKEMTTGSGRKSDEKGLFFQEWQ